ncbi:uncharacterized protein LOC144158527 isoform X1 [Haemaphysalis longicornis]
MSGNREVFAEEARASTRTAGGQRLYEERATDLEATVQQQTQSPLFRRQTRVNARQSEKAEARQEKRLAAAGAQDHRRQLNTPPPVCILATAAPSNAASNVSDQAPHGSCASWTTAGCMLPTRSDATTQYDVAVTTKSTACSNLGKETKATQCFPVKVSTGSQTTDLRRIRVAISRRGKESTKTASPGVHSFRHGNLVHENRSDQCEEIICKQNNRDHAYEDAKGSTTTTAVQVSAVSSETGVGKQDLVPSHHVSKSESSRLCIQTPTCTPGASYRCNLCSSAFVDDDALQAHKKSHPSSKSLKCPVCGRAFGFQTSFKYHMRIHANGQSLKCETCLRTFPTFAQLQRHKSSTHRKPFKCSVCPRAFSAGKVLAAHMRRHAGEKPFPCDLCPETFFLRKQLLLHKRDHEGERLFKCGTCSCSFLTNRACAVHMRVHEQKFQCKLCPRKFSKEERLSSHVMQSHTSKRQFGCKDCSSSFSCRAGLREHMRVHSKPYKCTICSQMFSRKSLMLVHLSRHTGTQSFKCRVCSEMFAFKRQLLNHMSQHEGVAVNKCSVCSRVVQSKSDLAIHMRQHTGEKPFRCETCARTFATRDNLLQHMKSHEKSFRCTVCSHAFSHRNRLTVHMRQHTGERPYKCEVCSCQFSAKSELSRHARRHAPGTELKCEVCARTFGKPSDLNRHRRVHDNPSMCSVCSICSLAFATKGELRQHLNVHEKPFKCPLCLKGFSKKCNMVDHVQRNSGDDKPYKCTYCAHTFVNLKNLSQHVRYHEELQLTGTKLNKKESTASSVGEASSSNSDESPYACATTSTNSSQAPYIWTGQYIWTINGIVLNYNGGSQN